MKADCEAKGLPTSGTKEVLRQRLELGIGDKRKVKKTEKAESMTIVPQEYFDKERKTLLEMGLTDELKIAEEVTRRYSVIASMKKPAPKLFPFPSRLPEVVLKQTNMVFVEVNDDQQYVYKMGWHDYSAASATDSAKSMRKDAVKSPQPELKSMTSPAAGTGKKRVERVETSEGKSEGKKVKRKVKREEVEEPITVSDDDEEEEVNDEEEEVAKDSHKATPLAPLATEMPNDAALASSLVDDAKLEPEEDWMTVPMKVSVDRMIKKASKENLLAVLRDFVSPVPENLTLKEVAELLGEQLHYETAEEDEDE